MIIYAIGNPLVPEDGLPLKFLPELRRAFPDIEFRTADPNENFPPDGERDIIVLDTVKGIGAPMLLDLADVEGLKRTPVSPHDYDLMFHLLLMNKTGRLKSVKIIGVATAGDLSAVKEIISAL